MAKPFTLMLLAGRDLVLGRAWPFCKSLAQDRRGATMVIIALTMSLMVAFMGLWLDTGIWYKLKRVVHNSADAAAISGAMERARGNSSTTISTAANTEAT